MRRNRTSGLGRSPATSAGCRPAPLMHIGPCPLYFGIPTRRPLGLNANGLSASCLVGALTASEALPGGRMGE